MGGRKTIGIIHNEAFQLLQRDYKKLWLIALIFTGISIVVGTVAELVTMPLSLLFGVGSVPLSLLENMGGSFDEWTALWAVPTIMMMVVLYFGLIALGLLVQIAVYAIQLGTYNATLQVMDGQKPSFQAEWNRFAANWKRYLAVYGWVTLWTFLWSLLFIVPGIVKGYSYRMAPMLVLRYPDITPREAVRLSQHMTAGYKGRLFGIDVLLVLYSLASVIGICVLVVGFFAAIQLWVLPMQLGMYAIVYRDILQASIDAGHMPPEPHEAVDGV